MRRLVFINAVLLTSIFSSGVMAQDAQLARGQAVYEHWCTPCHGGPDPRKYPGTSALQFLYQGEKPAMLEDRLDLTPELVAFYVRNGVTIMPFFRKTEISDEDLAALGAWLSKR
jgi:(+)-pinoresinol hydroxylase